jgi:hypothetical protein
MRTLFDRTQFRIGGIVRIWEENSVSRDNGLFDLEYTAESIRELEEQHEAGEIEPYAYLLKKQALVRLYLKATTSPRRRRRSYEDE